MRLPSFTTFINCFTVFCGFVRAAWSSRFSLKYLTLFKMYTSWVVLEITENKGQWRMLSTGGWRHWWAKFQSWNLSDLAAVRGQNRPTCENSFVHLAECPSSPDADSKWGFQPLASACHRAAWWAERKRVILIDDVSLPLVWCCLKFTQCTWKHFISAM